MNLEFSFLINKYAQAFMRYYGNRLDHADEQVMQTLIELFKQNSALLFFFKLPASFEIQQRFFLEKLKEKGALNDKLEALADLLMKDQRLFFLPEIARKIIQLLKERNDTIDGSVESSHELSDVQKKNIHSFVQKNSSKKVHLTFTINPDLIAGIRIYFDSRQWEYSIAQQLTTIERSLANGD